MRNKQLLRYSLASLTLIGAGLGTFLIACSDDDNGTPKTNNPGPDATTTDPDTDSGDGDSGKVDSGTPARLQFVNAATDLGPNNQSGGLRICFGAGTAEANVQVTGLPALPDQDTTDAGIPPGAYIGTGGNVTGTGLDLTPLYIQPYLMNAERLAARGIVKPGAGDPGKTCTEILGTTFDGGVMSGNGALVENVDYWKLPVIPANTFQKEKSYILVLTGCTQDTAADPGKCGEGFAPDGGAGAGNLKVWIHELDRTTAVDPDKIGAQFIHASQPAKQFLDGMAVGVLPAFVRNQADSGSSAPIATAAVAVNSKTQLAVAASINPATDLFSANALVESLAIPLTSIQAISFPSGVPEDAKLRNGAAFTFIAVGDPTEPTIVDGHFNTKKFHYLAFPNNPPVSVYKP